MVDLTKEQILGVRDAVVERVEVPEWGGAVYLRALSGSGRDEWDLFRVYSSGADGRLKQDVKHFRSMLIALCLCGPNGEPMGFQPEEVAKLGEKHHEVIDRLYDRCEEMSGLSREVSAKNSEGPSGVSGSS